MTASPDKLFLVMDHGTTHGWGNCGRYLASELSRLTQLYYVTNPFKLEDIGDVEQYERLCQCYLPPEKLIQLKNGQSRTDIDAPVIHTIGGIKFRPWLTDMKGSKTVGYTFFEENVISLEDLRWADDFYDIIAVGSSWCEKVLKHHGLKKTRTIIQGVDPLIFRRKGEKQRYLDSFVIFSGGKFELRKGQDIVMRAVKILQERYPDVLLVTSWYNHWLQSMNTMAASPYIKYQKPLDSYGNTMKQMVAINGLDPQRVVILPPLSNSLMPEVYRDSDIGFFPNRCEGGTNLVLMEYMACGRPVVASNLTGHQDVLDAQYACLVHAKSLLNIQKDGRVIARWADPDLDEAVAHLDWAYHNRDDLRAMGQLAATGMSFFTWQKAAKGFLDIIQ
jgi:glycosyltransferase involved in cell wall biosynthesis